MGYICLGCGGYDMVVISADADRVCRDCGLCCYEMDVGWETLDRTDYDRCRFKKKSVHCRSTYFMKRYVDSLPNLSSALRTELYRLQKTFVHAFRRQRSSRKYTPHYRFQLKKLLQLCDQHSIADTVPPLKGVKKIAALEEVWQQVCSEVGWTVTSFR